MVTRSIKTSLIQRCLMILTLSILANLIFTRYASAHAIVVRTDPVDDAVLDTAPSQIRIWFSEPVVLAFTTADLVDGEGQHYATTFVRHAPAESENDSTFMVVMGLPELKPHSYRLSWKTISSDDLHATLGSIVFGIQHVANIEPTVATVNVPQPIEVILRWLDFAALAGLVGALAIIVFILPQLNASETLQRVHHRLFRLALGSLGLAFVVGIGLLIAQSSMAGDDWWQIVAQSGYGIRVLVRQLLLIVLGLMIASLMTKRDQLPQRRWNAIVILLIVALASTESLTSHAASTGDISYVAVAVNALHLLAASVWSGGLVSLVIAIVPLQNRRFVEKAMVISILKRFGALAGICLLILIVTGLYNAGQQVASLDALMTTLYGQTLLVKVGLIVLVALIALFNATMLHPSIAGFWQRILRRPNRWIKFDPLVLRRTIGLEAIGVAVVLLFTASLSATQPARGPEFDPPRDNTETISSVSSNAADLFVTLSVKPNYPGQNFISVSVHDTRRPAPASIDHVVVQFRAPGESYSVTQTAEAVDGQRYQIAGGVLNMAGTWNISITINRRGLPDAMINVPWTVNKLLPEVKPRPVLVSNRPLAQILSTVALGVTLVSVLGLIIFQMWRSGVVAFLSRFSWR